MAERTEDELGGDGTRTSNLVAAAEVALQSPLKTSANGIRFAAFGENKLSPGELERIVQAVPQTIAAALAGKTYYFVPLAMASSAEHEHRGGANTTMISPVHTAELGDDAICHRNVRLGDAEGVFISTRLLNDRFALAFEFYINVGHAFVEYAGVPEAFQKLAWDHALKDVRGETSQDAWECRGQSMIRAHVSGPNGRSSGDRAPRLHVDEKAKLEFMEAAFADAVAIYQLSLAVDFNYSELREREYPLLAPGSLAERLRLVAKLFPVNPGYEFAIRYRRHA